MWGFVGIGVAVLLGFLVIAMPHRGPSDEDRIRACISRGGHAVFTSTYDGHATYIACEEKP